MFAIYQKIYCVIIIIGFFWNNRGKRIRLIKILLPRQQICRIKLYKTV